MTPAKGFTLIELMIVIAIVAILAAIALPMFGQYSYRAQRVDGQELLLRIATAQERFYSTNNKYGALTAVGYDDPALSEKGYYSVKVDLAADGQSYKATAAPKNQQLSDVCGDLSITDAGVKKPASTDPTFNTNGKCW